MSLRYEPVIHTTKAALYAVLADDGYCPKCLGETDTGNECLRCGYDAQRNAELGETLRRHRQATERSGG